MTDRLEELSAAGVAVWLDDLSRVRLAPASWNSSAASSTWSA